MYERGYEQRETFLRRHWRHGKAGMDMSSLRKSLMLFATTDAATSAGELELGRPRASHVPKSINGHSKFARIGKADYATGTAEADRQHGRVRKSTGGKHDSGGTTITRDDRSGIATHRFRTGYIFQRRVRCWCFRARFDQVE